MITAGIDLSVGMIFVLTNCLASWIVVGTPLETALGVVGVLVAGALCGALNGLIVIYGRLQPIVTTIATGAVYYGIALALRPVPGGSVNRDLADVLTGKIFGLSRRSLVMLALVVLVVWVPFSRSVARPRRLCGRFVRAGRLHVGRADRSGRSSSPTRCPACSPPLAGCS